MQRAQLIGKSLILVGLPGSGKSTVGGAISRRLGLPFIDTDKLIEHEIGCSISEYFAQEGEAAFRDIEEGVIASVAANFIGVMATGGGAVLRASNRQRLQEAGHVIYLHGSVDQLTRRLAGDRQRPLLQVSDPRAQVQRLYSERDLLYRSICEFVVETGRTSVTALTNVIIMQLELAGIVRAT